MLRLPKTKRTIPTMPKPSQANKRIDAGIKRGKRQPPIAIVHRDDILAKLYAGNQVKEIAEGYAITGAAIANVLAGDPEYVAARQQGIAARLERHYAEMKDAPDALALARARECYKASSWFAEREFSSRWGQQQRVEVTHREPPRLEITVVSPQQIADCCAASAQSASDDDIEDAQVIDKS